LNDRLRGQPLEVEAHIETQSILARTLILFGLMVVLAAATFAVLIWLVRRRGRAMQGAQEQEAS
jgi:cytochrome bd-type quinol oxidase subunit 1